jgi:NAD+ synthase
VTARLSIALAQTDPKVGDVRGNLARIRAARAQAAALGADLVVFSELVVSGYPPEDLVLKPAFQEACRAAVDSLAADTGDGGPGMIVGAPWVENGRLHNSGLLLDAGKIAALRHKHDLPNYGVFDEKRVFAAGPLPGRVVFRGVRLGLMICEDMWFPDSAECLVESGAEMLIVPNGSPFETDKLDERVALAGRRVAETGMPLIYVNQVGGQDELVFDGASFVLNGDRNLAAQAPTFAEDVSLTRWEKGAKGWVCVEGPRATAPDGLGAIYAALVLGLRDYVTKNGFPGTILGLSGGIDSALTAAIAADALGPAKVRAVMMPSRYTSQESLDDAAAFAKMLAPAFAGTNSGVAEENIQSRARGLALMALSNKFGHMVVSTGNKSEMSAGYGTLYGDMCGGFAVLKDVYKTTVFELSRWRNAHRPEGALGPKGPVMPERVIVKPPTAELRPDQTDEASLGPYVRLDAILQALVEGEKTVAEIVAKGYGEEEVRKVWRMLDLAEYKRRQAAPGVKITRRALGRERRYPIVNGFRG